MERASAFGRWAEREVWLVGKELGEGLVGQSVLQYGGGLGQRTEVSLLNLGCEGSEVNLHWATALRRSGLVSRADGVTLCS